MDEKSRDHEVIIGEPDNSESPISKEFKRKIFYSEHPENYKWRPTLGASLAVGLLGTLYAGDEEKM